MFDFIEQGLKQEFNEWVVAELPDIIQEITNMYLKINEDNIIEIKYYRRK